jgi:hypothetical protein
MAGGRAFEALTPAFATLPRLLVGALVLVVLFGSGLLVAATLRIETAARLLLAAYVIAFAQVVALTLFLSVFDSLTRLSLVAGTALLFFAAVALWLLVGRPRLNRPVRFTRSPPVLAATAVVTAAYGYLLALVVGTPPNGWDPLNYHLARAAFWLQDGRVGYIGDAYDQRLNFNPPNGEIGLSFALGTTRHETAAGFVQFFAALACALAVFALARRLRLGRSEALFGALLFLTLPIVLLQSSGDKNDLVVASFVLAACVFVFGSTRREVGLASVATALAIGTKFTAAYGLAVLVPLAAIAGGRTAAVRRTVAIAAGALIGAYWYVVNAVETGHLLGDQSTAGHLTAPFHPRENLLTAYGTAVDTLDLSGSQGRDLLLYCAAAIVLALCLRRPRAAALGAAIVLSPIALLVVSDHIGRPGLLHLDDWLGHPQGYLAAGDVVASSPRTASDTASWFGPLGFLLAAMTVILISRRRLGGARLLIAVAPLIWFVAVALTLTYNPWLGRFFVVPVALSAALWGAALRNHVTAWAAVTLAAVTALLSLDHYVEKPAGVRLLDRTRTTSVWQMARWQVQSQHDPPLAPVFQFVDQRVPSHDSIALALGTNEFGFPFFGPHLERRVELVQSGSNGRAAASQWLFADSQRAAAIDPGCWQQVLRAERGTIFRRRCPLP